MLRDTVFKPQHSKRKTSRREFDRKASMPYDDARCMMSDVSMPCDDARCMMSDVSMPYDDARCMVSDADA